MAHPRVVEQNYITGALSCNYNYVLLNIKLFVSNNPTYIYIVQLHINTYNMYIIHTYYIVWRLVFYKWNFSRIFNVIYSQALFPWESNANSWTNVNKIQEIRKHIIIATEVGNSISVLVWLSFFLPLLLYILKPVSPRRTLSFALSPRLLQHYNLQLLHVQWSWRTANHNLSK